MNRVLVTGTHGFLGRNTASLFKQKGYEVIGIGHGHWGFDQPDNFGIDQWIEADVDSAGLSHVTGRVDCVIHCAGGSSVGHAVEQPLQEFRRTVESTVHVLEFIRTKHPYATIIYPSSAAVYGHHSDSPITEDDQIAPISPYGFYKKIVEDLCESYARAFGISAVIIRFFSIYGAGLQKQLLWDGCTKLSSGEKTAKFYGTGKETRDWIHVEDAAELIYLLAISHNNGLKIYNGGSGKRISVKKILSMLSKELGSSVEIVMGKEEKLGDPKHYWADISKIIELGWVPQKTIAEGLHEYVKWFKEQSC